MPLKKKTAPSASQPRAEIGILGGTGLYEIEGFKNLKEHQLKTPFGDPSDAYMVGTLEGRRVAFLSRHGRGHRYLPADVNYRANVYGFKMLGVERIISVNSVGSLRAEIKPRDIVFADQFIDKTHRLSTFFDRGIAAHVALAEPVCGVLSRHLYRTAEDLGIRSHPGGTYVCMEGPAFSTKAESEMHRLWGGSVIGMTGATEAKLFREAEICYATMNLATDYDCWHAGEESVTVDLILENLRLNIHNAKTIIRKAVASLPPHDDAACGCRNALAGALVTDPKRITPAMRRRLALIIGKYLPGGVR
ncbi:MAG: S-methyl-5'-thioadenosine phosphorylase [Acidobacteriota bacterium]|nr:S-methyl-5'-thioadenosine phosphorylase [Acidobacteriota bacterium]